MYVICIYYIINTTCIDFYTKWKTWFFFQLGYKMGQEGLHENCQRPEQSLWNCFICALPHCVSSLMLSQGSSRWETAFTDECCLLLGDHPLMGIFKNCYPEKLDCHMNFVTFQLFGIMATIALTNICLWFL